MSHSTLSKQHLEYYQRQIAGSLRHIRLETVLESRKQLKGKASSDLRQAIAEVLEKFSDCYTLAELQDISFSVEVIESAVEIFFQRLNKMATKAARKRSRRIKLISVAKAMQLQRDASQK